MKQPQKKRRVTLLIDVKRCPKCLEVKSANEYHKYYKGAGGLAYYCKVCACAKTRASQAKTRGCAARAHRVKSAYIKRTYGMSLVQHQRLLGRQGGMCAICHEALGVGAGTHLDHDHLTGRVRAFLCSGCNRGLGYFGDNPALLNAAASYLEQRR